MSDDITLQQLVEDLATDGGPDLRGYKTSTLQRRINRRMFQVGEQTYSGYRKYVRSMQGEPEDLLNAVLINVTEFFRDPQAWDYLREQVLPHLLRPLHPGDSFRAWSVGCATGEEAYTLAIVLAEYFREQLSKYDIKIYATDIHEEALNVARRGIYPAERLRRLSGELRQKYFENGAHLRVSRELRRLVIFGRSNIVSDPPISHCHVVICRNLLIYFDGKTQKRILDNLLYALRPGGVLFLGKAESKLTDFPVLQPLSSRWRIFQRQPETSNHGVPENLLMVVPSAEVKRKQKELDALKLSYRQILETLNAGVLVLDANDVIVTANPSTAEVWGVAPSMLHGKRVQESDLSSRCPELLSHLEALRSGKHDHIKFSCIIHVGAEARRLSISLRRLAGDRSEPAGALVFCDDVTDREKLQSAVEQLEATSEELQSANEELETTNEELQSTNEELETTNEELQSTNEELETTNEELQSLNEELENMNEELERSTEELHAVSARYAETLQNLPWPVLLLDGQERVRLWNSAAERVFGITPTAVLGQGIDVLPLDGNLHEAIARNSRGVAQKGKAAMLRGQQVTMKGATRVFDLHFTPLAPHRHESEGVLVVFNPIEVNGAAATSPAEGKTAATTVKRVGSARKKSKTPSRSRAGSKKK